ncbi:MAG: right-handed parallel beta-helix repeat-containing protein, partial [Bacteroidetes bacterium]|nr:right-handed parallel beta-helix repeat-containing protein [Bacteroidota bacterium]
MNRSFLLLLATFFSSLLVEAQQKTIYVAPNGKGNGSQAAPFGSPEQAIAALGGATDATIYFRAGTYALNKSLIVTTPVTLAAYNNEKVILSGGVQLKAGDFTPIKDQAVIDRLPAAAKGNVYQVDLRARGITDFGKGLPHGYKKNHPADLELFDNGKPLTMARWPNEGLAPIGRVTDPGSNPRKGDKDNRGATFTVDDNRAANWKSVSNAWVGGFFSYGYSDDYMKVDKVDASSKTITLKDAAEYTVFSSSDESAANLKNSQQQRGFYIYNLPEELDRPGEYYLDKTAGKLYVWLPEAPGAGDLQVSVMEDPLLILKGAKGATVKGLAFEYSRGMGLQLADADNARITGCTFANLGTIGISSNNQTTHLTVNSCKIFNTGTGGMVINGGDRKSQTPAGNVVDNCEIYNFSRIDKTYSPGIFINGVGNHITHCYIHDAPDMAIVFYGNDQEISYNHIQRVVQDVTDAGAVYTGRDLSSTGNVISNNFFDDISGKQGNSVSALYLDDGTCGIEADANVFYRCGGQGTYHFGAVHINGGGE